MLAAPQSWNAASPHATERVPAGSCGRRSGVDTTPPPRIDLLTSSRPEVENTAARLKCGPTGWRRSDEVAESCGKSAFSERAWRRSGEVMTPTPKTPPHLPKCGENSSRPTPATQGLDSTPGPSVAKVRERFANLSPSPCGRLAFAVSAPALSPARASGKPPPTCQRSPSLDQVATPLRPHRRPSSGVSPAVSRRPSRGVSPAPRAPAAILGVGSGGVEELQQHLDDATVSWALLRFQIGGGTFARSKLVAVHSNGESTPVIQRGWLNAQGAEALAMLGDVSACLQVTRADELTVDYLCERLLPLFVADDLNYSRQDLLREYASMIAQAKEAEKRRRQELQLQHHEQKEQQPALEAKPCIEQHDIEVPRSKASERQPTSAEQAMKAVANDNGEYNWVLLAPGRLQLHAAGHGGLEEMRQHLVEDMVLFGALRLSFGQPPCSRGRAASPTNQAGRLTKHVFVHWVGPRVGVVQRGKWNAKLKEAATCIAAHCAVTFRREAHRREDLRLEDIVAELRRLTVIDGVASGFISVQAYLAALAEEARERQEAIAAERRVAASRRVGVEAGAERRAGASTPQRLGVAAYGDHALGPDPLGSKLPDLRTAVQSVRATSGTWNWVLCGWVEHGAQAHSPTRQPSQPPLAQAVTPPQLHVGPVSPSPPAAQLDVASALSAEPKAATTPTVPAPSTPTPSRCPPAPGDAQRQSGHFVASDARRRSSQQSPLPAKRLEELAPMRSSTNGARSHQLSSNASGSPSVADRVAAFATPRSPVPSSPSQAVSASTGESRQRIDTSRQAAPSTPRSSAAPGTAASRTTARPQAPKTAPPSSVAVRAYAVQSERNEGMQSAMARWKAREAAEAERSASERRAKEAFDARRREALHRAKGTPRRSDVGHQPKSSAPLSPDGLENSQAKHCEVGQRPKLVASPILDATEKHKLRCAGPRYSPKNGGA